VFRKVQQIAKLEGFLVHALLLELNSPCQFVELEGGPPRVSRAAILVDSSPANHQADEMILSDLLRTFFRLNKIIDSCKLYPLYDSPLPPKKRF